MEVTSTESIPTTLQSLDDYLLEVYGPKQLSFYKSIPVTIVYLVIFITGIVGNAIVCLVIVKNTYMHTATNYYIFNLAVSDVALLLLGLPNDLSVFWHQYPYKLGEGFCKFRALLSETASYVSVLTIVAFSMERYLAICHPLHLYTMSGLQRAVRIIGVIWLMSLLSAVPFAVYTKINYLDYPPGSDRDALESAFCAMLEQPKGWPIWELSSVLFFIVPMLIIGVLYARMGFRIRNRTKNSLGKGVNGSVHGETRHSQSRKAIIRMLAAVVIAFFVCWAPFHAQRLLFIYGKESQHFNTINEWMFYITGVLYYVSSTVNPILYNVMSNRYRVAFKETLCGANTGSMKRNAAFTREQSSFRETLVGGGYDGTQLVRVRSIAPDRKRYSQRFNHTVRRETTNTVTWEEQRGMLEDDKLVNHDDSDNVKTAEVVVIVNSSLNGKTKCYTANSTVKSANNFEQKSTLACIEESDNSKSDINLVETCI